MSEVAYVSASRIFPGTPPVRAVTKLDLEISDGELLVLAGPPGSGKTTALRMLAGLEDVDEGAITIGGSDVTNAPPKVRDIAMVFQSYAPEKIVADNLAFALKLRKTPKEQIQQKVTEAARLLDLEPYLDRETKTLSAVQRQQVAMGRAVVREPSVFLMDEPLSHLDPELRVEARANIAALQNRLATTTVYAARDQIEAMTLGHRVAVLKDGLLQQVGTPQQLYDNPANAFVAGFIGSPAMNLKTVPLSVRGAVFGERTIPLPRSAMSGTGSLKQATCGIRPESLRLGTGSENGMTMTVELVEEVGDEMLVHGTIDVGGGSERFVVRTEGRTPPAPGERVTVVLRNPGEVHLFHPDSGTRITS